MALTAKDIRGTTVRKQLDAYAKAEGLTPKQKGDLTKKFLANINSNHTGANRSEHAIEFGISGCFFWNATPEGWDLWNKVDGIYIK